MIKMLSRIQVFIAFLVALTAVFITMVLTNQISLKGSTNSDATSSDEVIGSFAFGEGKKRIGDNYIDPKPFNVGPIKTTGPYKSANQCNTSVLLPINEIEVDYGGPKIPSDCSCLAFIQSP